LIALSIVKSKYVDTIKNRDYQKNIFSFVGTQCL